jgi:micrococcal nuclease
MGEWVYEAKVVSVYDGDTVTVDLDMGMRVWQKGVRLRLLGIDAPEMTGTEKAEGIVSRDALRGLLPVGKSVRIVSHEFEKYGRLLATVYVLVEGVELNVNQHMLVGGYAKAIPI